MHKFSIQFISILLFIILPLVSIGQDEKQIYIDLGKIKKNNEDVVDLIINNPFDEEIELLSFDAEAPMKFQLRQSKIPAGGYEFFRLKINQMNLGDFNKTLKLHFHKTELDLVIHVSGHLSKLPSNGLQDCPTFNDIPSRRQLAKRQKKVNGEIQSRLILLGESELKSEQAELLDETYKPNNIIFLIDISSSMGRHGKMDLLKGSMKELLNSLRSEDYLSMVAYDDKARLLMQTSTAEKKEEIAEIIDALESKGSTNAIEGIELAISTAMDNFLEEGNNQLYLVSDGAFELKYGSKGTKATIREASEKGLRVSVLGISPNKISRKSLKSLAKVGKGELIKINKEQDQQLILKNIKANSKI